MDLTELIALGTSLAVGINPIALGSVVGFLVVTKGISAAIPNHPIGRGAGAMFNLATSPFKLVNSLGGKAMQKLSQSKPEAPTETEEK